MVACRFGISFLVFNSTSHSFAVLTRELSSQTLEEKFHIYARPCIILYLSSIKLKGVRSLFKKIRFKMSFKTVN